MGKGFNSPRLHSSRCEKTPLARGFFVASVWPMDLPSFSNRMVVSRGGGYHADRAAIFDPWGQGDGRIDTSLNSRRAALAAGESINRFDICGGRRGGWNSAHSPGPTGLNCGLKSRGEANSFAPVLGRRVMSQSPWMARAARKWWRGSSIRCSRRPASTCCRPDAIPPVGAPTRTGRLSRRRGRWCRFRIRCRK